MDQKVKEKLKPSEKSYFSTKFGNRLAFYLLSITICTMQWVPVTMGQKILDLGLKTHVCHVVAQMLGGFINRPQIFWQIFTDLLGARKKYDCKKAQK